jgi:hypothetical protein
MTTTTTRFVALLAALLLTVAEFLIMEYDAQRHVARYLTEADSTEVQRG